MTLELCPMCKGECARFKETPDGEHTEERCPTCKGNGMVPVDGITEISDEPTLGVL